MVSSAKREVQHRKLRRRHPQSLLAPSPDLKTTQCQIILTQYEFCLARTIPSISRLESSPSPSPAVSGIHSIKESSLIISFLGMPTEEYLDRAKVVYDHRVPAWNLVIGVGGRCSSGTARCSSNLRCAGPESQEQCHPQVATGGACDFKYKICKTELVCEKGICQSQHDAFKGEIKDECGGPGGAKCEMCFGCTSWSPDTTGKCLSILLLGLTKNKSLT